MLNTNFSVVELPKLILASGSPRRSEILTSVGWPFEKVVPDIDESERADETAESYVKRLAEEKAGIIAAANDGKMVLGADTTVVVDDEIIGKPDDIAHAREMITMLAGRWHEVLTGVALIKGSRSAVGMQRTRVKFAPMTMEEIAFLAERGDPLDKAGAYAVQAQAALFIEAIEGDYWNVVGLPVNLVYRLFNELTAERNA